MKRAVVLLGAGASIDYGAPSTLKLTNTIERKIRGDSVMRHTGGDVAYLKILAGLTGYLQGIVHFEQIYHCTHELIYMFPPTPGASDEFRPLLLPFISTLGVTENALRALAHKIVEVVYSETSYCCGAPAVSLTPLADFITRLRKDYITRIYTTNYDDFLLQAVPNLYTGFDPGATSPKRFELESFWQKEDEDSLFQLHGSVHMGFSNPFAAGGEIGDLFWFDDRDDARTHAMFTGGDVRRPDGTGFLRTSVITGLDKLSRLQQRPLSHFYSALARDAMLCDVIFVIGSGLADLHLNTWLHEARSRTPRTPILFIDLWRDGFDRQLLRLDAKLSRLFHSLKIEINEHIQAILPRLGGPYRTTGRLQYGIRAFRNF